MKVTLINSKEQFAYNSDSIFKKDNLVAVYTTNNIFSKITGSKIGKLTRISGEIYGVLLDHSKTFVHTNSSDKTIRDAYSNHVLATYTGTPTGAVATYIVSIYLSFTSTYKTSKDMPSKKCNSQNSIMQPANNNINSNSLNNVKQTIKKSPKEMPKAIPFKQFEKVLLEYPKNEKSIEHKTFEKPEVKEEPIPKEKHDSKDFNLPIAPTTPIPESAGSFGNIVAFLIILLMIYVAIKMIPGSWRDLSSIGDSSVDGIQYAFFPTALGGLGALIYSLFARNPKFTKAFSIFGIATIIGVVITSLILIFCVIAGETEFLGLGLIDIPLAIFAAILGTFQFAFPIAIGVAIVCGIICAVKKN